MLFATIEIDMYDTDTVVTGYRNDATHGLLNVASVAVTKEPTTDHDTTTDDDDEPSKHQPI